MSALRPAALLRHRPPALLIRAVVAREDDCLTCSAEDGGVWPWPRMLEGAAQTAGLLVGLQQGGLSRTAVIAEYRDVRVHVARHVGTVCFTARLDRRILQFWRCRLEVRAADGTLLVDGRVSLAPGETA